MDFSSIHSSSHYKPLVSTHGSGSEQTQSDTNSIDLDAHLAQHEDAHLQHHSSLRHHRQSEIGGTAQKFACINDTHYNESEHSHMATKPGCTKNYMLHLYEEYGTFFGKVFTVIMFYLVGCLFYGAKEGWSILDSIYFTTVTISTGIYYIHVVIE